MIVHESLKNRIEVAWPVLGGPRADQWSFRATYGPYYAIEAYPEGEDGRWASQLVLVLTGPLPGAAARLLALALSEGAPDWVRRVAVSEAASAARSEAEMVMVAVVAACFRLEPPQFELAQREIAVAVAAVQATGRKP